MGMIERSIEVERPAEDVWACGPDRSRFTVRINFTMPFGLLGAGGERPRRAAPGPCEAEAVLTNVKTQLEATDAVEKRGAG